MNRDFVTALLQLNAEKQVPRDQLIRTVEDAIQSAYRRQPGDEDVCVRIDGETGRIRVFRAKVAVGEIVDPLTEFSLDEAKAFNPDAVLGDLVEIEEMDPNSFGRIHAQTAKQVVLQRLREAERDVAFDQFASRDGELITGSVNRIEPRAIILELVGQGGVARAEAILATTEQSPLEHYRIGQNVKALVLEVRRGLRGPQLFVSRSHKNFLRRLFELEVPEIHNGTVEIKAIAREAGSRSKVAVVEPPGRPRPGRRDGRPARRAGPGGRGRAGRREDRRDPLERRSGRVRGQCPEPGPGARRPDRRGASDRQRDRARADALAGDRPRGPERPAGRQADRLADRHPQRRQRGRGCPGGRRGRRPRPPPSRSPRSSSPVA